MWDINLTEKNLKTLQFPSVGKDVGFSWRPCFLCRRPLGGDRHELIYVDEGEIYAEEICVDCTLYLANGDIPEEEE